MKTLFYFLIVLVPLLSKGQAHLGSTLADIKAMHPNNNFIVDYTDEGVKYAYTAMPLGIFIYYFEKESELSNICAQIPDDMKALNAQVEIYNSKYVTESETSWKAYLEGGGIMEINLTYDDELKTYLFIYRQMESSPQIQESQTNLKST